MRTVQNKYGLLGVILLADPAFLALRTKNLRSQTSIRHSSSGPVSQGTSRLSEDVLGVPSCTPTPMSSQSRQHQMPTNVTTAQRSPLFVTSLLTSVRLLIVDVRVITLRDCARRCRAFRTEREIDESSEQMSKESKNPKHELGRE